MRYIKIIIYIILTIIILGICFFNIFSALDKDFFGYRIFKVGSNSMEPVLDVNDLIIIKEADIYDINDIVTYKTDETYITHRIVKISSDEVITRGDVNNTDDEPIKKENIYGKLVFKIRVNSFVLFLFTKVKFWILLFFVGILLLICLPNKYIIKK